MERSQMTQKHEPSACGCVAAFLAIGLFMAVFVVPPTSLRNVLIAFFVVGPVFIVMRVAVPRLFPGLMFRDEDSQVLKSTCLRCGSELSQDDKACPNCGWQWDGPSEHGDRPAQ